MQLGNTNNWFPLRLGPPTDSASEAEYWRYGHHSWSEAALKWSFFMIFHGETNGPWGHGTMDSRILWEAPIWIDMQNWLYRLPQNSSWNRTALKNFEELLARCHGFQSTFKSQFSAGSLMPCALRWKWGFCTNTLKCGCKANTHQYLLVFAHLSSVSLNLVQLHCINRRFFQRHLEIFGSKMIKVDSIGLVG